jgi:LacI family transcriptional regulator
MYPTIADIAKSAKLSASTVSRALNNHPRISEKTKRNVIALAREMGYVPNLFARSLAKKKSHLTALVLCEVRNPGVIKIAHAVQNTMAMVGYWVIQANTGDDQDGASAVLRSLFRMGVDGVIYAGTSLDNPVVESLIDDGFPLVLVNRRLRKEKGDYVISNYLHGAYLAVNHLFNLGYRRIALIHGGLHSSIAADSREGYLQAFRERNVEVDTDIIKEGPPSEQAGYTATREIVRLGNPPDAIFCYDDHQALGAMRGMVEAGMRVPEDIAIVGMDDIDIAAHPRIKLTTVRHDLEEIGRLGAKVLLDKIEGKLQDPQRIRLAPRLVLRGSCGSADFSLDSATEISSWK